MKVARVVGIVLIVAGLFGLVSGSFRYTRQTHQVDIGPIEVAAKEQRRVEIPVWAGVAAIVAGGALLLVGRGTRA